VWITTGNPDPNGSAIYRSYSIVRLSASTLAEQDWWTVPEGQTVDSDFGSSPVLYSAKVGGTATALAAACNKNGVFYAWRRGHLAAGPVWQRTVERPIPGPPPASARPPPTRPRCMSRPARRRSGVRRSRERCAR
jgi:hypothetical protein